MIPGPWSDTSRLDPDVRSLGKRSDGTDVQLNDWVGMPVANQLMACQLAGVLRGPPMDQTLQEHESTSAAAAAATATSSPGRATAAPQTPCTLVVRVISRDDFFASAVEEGRVRANSGGDPPLSWSLSFPGAAVAGAEEPFLAVVVEDQSL